MKNLPGSRFGKEQELPFDISPEVQQQQSQSDIKQAQGNGSRRGASANGVHQAITGFDAKAPPIELKNLVRLHFEFTDQDVSNLKSVVSVIASFAIFANDNDLEGLWPILFAGAGIGGLITASAL